MNRLKRLATVALLAMSLLAVVSTASAASPGSAGVHGRTIQAVAAGSRAALSTTDGSQRAKPGRPSSDDGSAYCDSGDHVVACFQRHGDRIWVWNEYSDPYQLVRAHWSNWLRSASGWKFWRNGDCVKQGHGWGYCDKNFYEDSSTNAYDRTGSGVRVYACNWACGWGYQWVRNNK